MSYHQHDSDTFHSLCRQHPLLAQRISQLEALYLGTGNFQERERVANEYRMSIEQLFAHETVEKTAVGTPAPKSPQVKYDESGTILGRIDGERIDRQAFPYDS
jgi:hypothetical protein